MDYRQELKCKLIKFLQSKGVYEEFIVALSCGGTNARDIDAFVGWCYSEGVKRTAIERCFYWDNFPLQGDGRWVLLSAEFYDIYDSIPSEESDPQWAKMWEE